MHFIGVELDSLSGRIAKALYPDHDIRIENFRDTRLPEGSVDAVIGNPPFADVKLEHTGHALLAPRLLPREVARRLEARAASWPWSRRTTRSTSRTPRSASTSPTRADFLGAIRLPSDAFAREGTRVVTDIVFLRKRGPGEPAGHVDPSWLEVSPLAIEGVEVPINRYFLTHPEMVLGPWSRRGQALRGRAGFQRRLDRPARRRPPCRRRSAPGA